MFMAEDATVSEETAGVSEDQAQTDGGQEEKSTEEATESNTEEAEAKDEKSDAKGSDDSFTSLNPDELPDNLKEMYRNMQADYVKKTQALAEDKKKAQLYDQMAQEQMVQQKFPKPEEVQATQESEDYISQALGVDPSTLGAEEKQQLDNLVKVVEAVAQKRIQEQITPLQNTLMTRDYRQELTEVKGRYPDFDKYVPQIKEILNNNSQMSYEQAYKIASFEDREVKGRTQAVQNREVKKKQASLKTSPASEKDEPANNFESIFGWAKKKINS